MSNTDPAVSETPVSPVSLTAQLDPNLSRGMWLVKWFLAIPHFIVLVFLWIGSMLATIVAGVSILFTHRYPRGLFDYNVGVMRWTWRVIYYAGHGGLGTDQYPPFTLADVEDYPARLNITPPGELSRKLVLVKWWLLAIPHYLVIGALLGSGGTYIEATDQWIGGTPGLIPVLVFIAAVGLLFTGRYIASLFDLVIGLNRWVFRVMAYTGLMTDTYPPFQLDQGGEETTG
jgi:hypothetical protein